MQIHKEKQRVWQLIRITEVMMVDQGSSGEVRKWMDLLNYVKAKFRWFVFSLNMGHQRKNIKHKSNILGLIKGKDESDICWDGKD